MKLRSYVAIWYVGLLAGCGGKIGSIKGSAPMIILGALPLIAVALKLVREPWAVTGGKGR